MYINAIIDPERENDRVEKDAPIVVNRHAIGPGLPFARAAFGGASLERLTPTSATLPQISPAIRPHSLADDSKTVSSMQNLILAITPSISSLTHQTLIHSAIY